MSPSKWERSQILEKEYNESDKPKEWKIPYSFNYWKNFINITDFEGLNLEVGCGSNGIWRFSDQIIGSDSLDFSSFGKNFVQANVEKLPFEDNHFRDVYSINMIDHTENPKKALIEMIRVSSHRVYLFSNVFVEYMKPVMNIFDALHPHHFTEADVLNLVPDTVNISMVKQTYFTDSQHMNSTFMLKTKLILAQILGTHSLIIHLDKKV
jgi:SAM-dependent methyltransferase